MPGALAELREAVYALDGIPATSSAATIQEPPEQQPSAIFQQAGPEAVALRLRWSDADSALDALGEELTDRPEIANDPELLELAREADHALFAYREALTVKLRKLCGVVP